MQITKFLKSSRAHLRCFLSIGIPILLTQGIIGCAGVNFGQWHFPYMMEVQQGNYITQEQINQLRLGLTKEQVSFILSKPLTQFIYDEQRWDFFYQDYTNNKLQRQYHVTLFFNKHDRLIKLVSTGDLP